MNEEDGGLAGGESSIDGNLLSRYLDRVLIGVQDVNGLGLDDQRDYVKSAARSQGWEVVIAEYTETVSGTVPARTA